MNYPRLARLGLSLLLSGFTLSALDTPSSKPGSALDQGCARALALADKEGMQDYRGWLKYLSHEARFWASSKGLESAEAKQAQGRLEEWTARIEANPRILDSLRGVQEWAYESPADSTGQPFKLIIPTDYDPKRPTPLLVYMHGYSGNHLEHSTGFADRPGSFEVAVLGRARGGWYRSLSEADVLAVVATIRAHWNIDADRIHLSGGSMGGGATFRLASRYPHLWASGRPTCGFAPNVPMGNLLHSPIYATHSDDDWVVPIIQSRAPLALLRAMGGIGIADETTGLGHAAWDYAEGNRNGDAWREKQVRADSRKIRRIDHTVTDGAAPRGWWAEVAEWGPENKPARFRLSVGGANLLQAGLENITRLRLHLGESPLDAAKPLSLSVNGRPPITVPAPLPRTADLIRQGESFVLGPIAAPKGVRLHTPGGASLLFQGEPLLIVYGTGGSDADRNAMLSAASIACRSPNPAWGQGGERGKDEIPHVQMTYGSLPIKADSEVSEDDIARRHLVLIGTASQNSLVARMADKLPVSLSQGAIRCSDGLSLPSEGAMTGLVHFNPLSPTRLLFWVATEQPADYEHGAMMPLVADQAGLGSDFLVVGTKELSLRVVRSFASDWTWTPGRDRSPLLPAWVKTHGDLTAFLSGILRKDTGADYALGLVYGPRDALCSMAGVTRISDLQTLFYLSGVAEMTLRGEELKQALRGILSYKGEGSRPACAIFPLPAESDIDADRLYRIVMPSDAMPSFGSSTRLAPRSVRITDLTLQDALSRYVP